MGFKHGASGDLKILQFDACPHSYLPEKKEEKRVVLLQGPVGPFFKRFRSHLEKNGYDAWHICFNPADRLFSQKRNRINFRGDLADWESWFSSFLSAAHVDKIILFGSERPIHRVARKLAAAAHIRVISLEEGYVRPGFITIEEGGNNASSPLAGQVPSASSTTPEYPDHETEDFKGFWLMCGYGTIYYVVRQFFTFGKQKQLMHRRFFAAPEIFFWIRNGWRRVFRHAHNSSKIGHLTKKHSGNFYLVPMQVAADTQLQDAAQGWSLMRLISTTLKSFAEHAPAHCRLVFKVHPLERGHCNNQPLIIDTAKVYGVADRVDILDAGSLGHLASHAAGMITINSTSGLSAIYHGIPLLVMGKAVYGHPDLVLFGDHQSDLDSFWSCGHVADKVLRRAYLNWIKHEALVHGDFYAKKGQETALQSILTRVRERRPAETIPIKAKNAC